MRELTANTFVSLDGILQSPGGPDEDPTGGFEQGGWSVGYWDDVMQDVMGAAMDRPFDLVLGRKTYEIFAAHWPYSDEPAAGALNGAAKHVASTTLTGELTWQNACLLEGDVPTAIRALKDQDGPELQVHGSGNLLQTLLGHGLVDELRVWLFPLVLGRGKRLFEAGLDPFGLTLTDSTVATSGVIVATYRPGAEIKSGSFVPEHPSEAELARRASLD